MMAAPPACKPASPGGTMSAKPASLATKGSAAPGSHASQISGDTTGDHRVAKGGGWPVAAARSVKRCSKAPS